MEATRIVEAIKESGVKRIAFIDDAFDRPELEELDWGQVLAFLEQVPQDIRQECGIDDELHTTAVEDIGRGAYTSAEVHKCLDLLYATYVRKADKKFDPGYFEENRKDTLKAVRPLLQLIGDCGPDIDIMTFGTRIAPAGDEGIQVVFVDLYMDPSVAPKGEPVKEVGDKAIEQSLEKIKPLMPSHPAVILMSSHDAAERANLYRERIESRVYASRFGFVHKDKFSRKKNRAIVEPEVSDVLLDIFQGYKFGRDLYRSLQNWEESAKKAVQDIGTGLAALQLRDISYLVRFRLGDEGQSLPEYLEWLLGECLIDQLGKNSDLLAISNESLTVQEAAKIEGAFDGPTATVARLYHNVRVEDARENTRQNFRLGDLYYRPADPKKKIVEHVVAVMNPDCDLVWRPTAQNPGRSAANLHLLKGHLQDFQSAGTSIGDFIFIKGQARNITWNYKSFETRPFTGVFEKPGQSDDEYTYIGAMRPLYAQEIQANLLNQMGRVGVAVPPALAFAATLHLSHADSGGKITTEPLKVDNGPLGYIVPSRISGGETRLVFKRGFVRALKAAMEKISADKLSEEAKKQLAAFNKADVESKMRKLCSAGVLVGQAPDFGIHFSGEIPARRPNGGPWCWVSAVVSESKSTDSAPAGSSGESATPAEHTSTEGIGVSAQAEEGSTPANKMH